MSLAGLPGEAVSFDHDEVLGVVAGNECRLRGLRGDLDLVVGQRIDHDCSLQLVVSERHRFLLVLPVRGELGMQLTQRI